MNDMIVSSTLRVAEERGMQGVAVAERSGACRVFKLTHPQLKLTHPQLNSQLPACLPACLPASVAGQSNMDSEAVAVGSTCPSFSAFSVGESATESRAGGVQAADRGMTLHDEAGGGQTEA